MNRERDERRWRRVAEVLLDEAHHMSTTKTRAEKLVEVAQIWDGQLHEPAKASGFYAEAAELDQAIAPKAIKLLMGLAQRTGEAAVNRILLDVLERTGREAELIKALQFIADRESDPAGALVLYLKAGFMAAESVGDRLASRACLVSAHRVAEDAGDLKVLEQATRHLKIWPADEVVAALRAMLLVENERAQDAVDTLVTASIHASESKVKAKLRLRAAAVAVDVTGQATEAVTYLRDALALEPSVASQAREVLDSIIESWSMSIDLGDLLVEVLDTLGDYDRAQHVLSQCVQIADVSRKGELLLKQATHAEENLRSAQRAFELFHQAALVTVDDIEPCIAGMRRAAWEGVDGAFDVLTDFLRQVQRWSDLVELLDGQAMLSADDVERAGTTYAIAQILEEHVEDLDGALSHYLQAFRLDDTIEDYALAAERIYRKQGQWDMVDNLLERRFELTENQEKRTTIRVEQGVVRHRHLGEHLAAYDILRETLREAGGDSSSIVYPVLSDLVLDVWAFPVIEEGLRARIAAADSTRRSARLTQELSFLYLEFIHDTDKGLALLREAADSCPADPTVFERVTQQYERHADDLLLAKWLEGVQERPLDAAFKSDILEQAAEIYDTLKADWLIVRRLWEARLRISPADVDLVNTAVNVAQSEGDDEMVAWALSTALEASDGESKTSELTRLGWMRQLAESHRAQGDVGAEVRHHRAILAQWPLDRDAFDALHRCYSEQSDWRNLVELLRDTVLVREQGDAGLDVPGRLEWARVMRSELEDNQAAAAVLEPLVEQEALDEESADLLIAAYEDLEDVTGLFSVLEARLVATDGTEQALIIERMEALAEEHHDLSYLGESVLHHKVNQDPTAMAPRLELISLYRESRDGERLLYELEAAWCMEPKVENIGLLRERAQLLAENSDSVTEAVAAWEELLELLPEDLEALTGLQFLYGQQHRYDDVRAIIQKRLEGTDDTSVRLKLLREDAILAELRFGDLEAAFANWKLAYDLAPNEPEILEELIRLSEERNDVAGLLEYGQSWFQQTDAPDDVNLLRRIAQAADQEKADAVAVTCWNRLLELEPDDGEVLQRLALDVDRRGDSRGAADMYQRLAAADVSMRQRRDALRRRGVLLVEMDELAEAAETYRALAEVETGSVEALLKVRELAEQLGRYEDAVQALIAAADRETAAGERSELCRDIARMLTQHLGDELKAATYWEGVLSFDPNDAEALGAIWPVYARQGRNLDMLRTLDSLVRGATDANSGGNFLMSAARLIRSEREDPALAFECWWRAHRLSGGRSKETLKELEVLASAADRWSDYADALIIATESEPDEDVRREYFVRAVQIAEETLKDSGVVFEYARRGLLEDPDEAQLLNALRRAAEEVGLASTWGVAADTLKFVAENCSETRADLYVEAAHASLKCHDRQTNAFELLSVAMRISGGHDGRTELFELAETLGKSEILADLIRTCVESAPEEERPDLLGNIAKEYEARADGSERALELYLQAIQLEPSHSESRRDVWRLAESLNAWPLVARFFEQLVDLSTDPQARFEFLRNKASIERDWLGEETQAFATMKRAIAAMPLDAEARQTLESWADTAEAKRSLAEFYESEGGWAELDGARRVLLRSAADIYRSIGDTEAASRALARVSDIAPDDEDVIDERLELFEQSGNYKSLGEVLARQSERARGERRLELLRKLGRLYDGKLGGQARADSAWSQILESAPLDDEAFRALGRSLKGAGDWAALETMIARRIPHLEPSLQIDELRTRVELLCGPLDRPDRAFDVLSELAERLPGEVDIFIRLELLISETNQAKRLLRLAESTLDKSETEIPTLLRLIGRLAIDWLSRPQKALDALHRALTLEPGDLLLARRVGELLSQQRKHQALLKLYQDVGEAYFEEDEENSARTQWHMSVALLQEEKLLDFAGAVATHEALLRDVPDYIPSLERLRTLLARLRDAPRLVSVLERLAEITEQPRKVMILVEGARAIQGMGQLEASVPLWSSILVHAPGHEEAQEIVERFARRSEDWDTVSDVFHARVRSTRDPHERASKLCALASFERAQRGDNEAALSALQLAHEAAPDHVLAMVDLAEILLESDGSTDLNPIGEILVRRTDQSLTDKDSQLLLPRMAQVQVARARHRLGEDKSEEALELLSVGYRRAPNDRALAQLYADRLYEAGQIVEAGHIYDHTILPTFEPGGEGDTLRAQEHLRRAQALASIELDVQAIHHYEAAARFPATRASALEALANIQEQAGRWEAAARYREKVAELAEDPAVGALSLVAAGTILHEKLGRFHRAVNLYRRAVKMGVTEPVMLLRILDALHTAGRAEDALIVVERLLEVDLSPQSKARLQTKRADLLSQTDRPLEAMTALVKAIEADPDDTDRLADLFSIIDGIGDEDRAESLEQLKHAVAASSGDARLALSLRLAAWHETQGDLAEALDLLDGLEARGDVAHQVLDGRARLCSQLAQIRGDSDLLASAFEARFASLQAEPGEPSSLEHLAELFSMTGKSDDAAFPLGILGLFGLGPSSPRMSCRVPIFEAPLALIPPTPAIAAVSELLNPVFTSVMVPLNTLFHEARVDEFGDVELYEETVEIIDRTYKALGLSEVDVFLVRGASIGVEVINLSPLQLLVGEDIVGRSSEAELAFRAARTSHLVTGENALYSSLPSGERLAFFGAVMALSDVERGPEYALEMGADEDRIAYWAGFLMEETTEEQRLEWMERAGRVIDCGEDAFTAWTHWVYSSANRIGLFAAGDFAAAAKCLKGESAIGRQLAVSGPADFRALLSQVPEIAAIYAFAFSPDYWRRRWSVEEWSS